MAKLLVTVHVILCLISLSAACTYTYIRVCESIKMRECDGGTAWDRVESKSYPLTSPDQSIQPVMRCTWRATFCGKKHRHLQAKRRKKLWSRSNTIVLLLLLLLSGDVETNPGPKTGLESVDGNTVLGEYDLRDVLCAVARLSGRWENLGISLGVHPSDLDTIHLANTNSPRNCLIKMLKLWLKQSYNEKRFGEPTWRRLVEAVEDKVGGDNPALAQEIAREHPCASDIQEELQPSESQSSTAQEDDWKGRKPSKTMPTEGTATQETRRKGKVIEEELKSKPHKQEPCPSYNHFHFVDFRDEVNQATVGQLFKDAVERFPTHPALKYKECRTWKTITYTEYYNLCIKAAKSFLKLGLKPKHAVCILGFNSPEWVISALGAMFARGRPTGIYTSSKPEACHFVANSSRANIIVVENVKQREKILKVRKYLPHLKAIVQYRGKLSKKYPNVYEWEEFLKLGDEIQESAVEKKIDSQKSNHCAELFYSSGTVDAPEVAMVSHKNLTFSAKALVQTYGRLEYGKERGVSYLPLSHISAQMADIYLPLLLGATVYFAEPDAWKLQDSLGETLREAQPTFFFGVPGVYEKMMEHLQVYGSSISGVKSVISTWAKKKGLKGNENRQKNQSLPWGWAFAKLMVFNKVRDALGFQQCKIFAVGAAPLRKEVHEYFMSINIPLMELYGMTECSGCHTVNLRHNHNGWRVGSCGKPIQGVKLKIVDPDDNREREEGEEGEICISGPHVFMGYLKNEEKTSEAIDDDKWLHSRDIGKIQDGFLYITGRIKEVITTSGGEKIPPVPIEDRIKREIPFLSNVMVVGHKRKFLTCLMTLKCEMDKDTEKPLDILTPQAQQMIQTLGSQNTRISEIIAQEDRAVFTAIQKGVDRVNEHATSSAQKVQKWNLLPSDFSISGGELGPTLKVRRYVVQKKYKTTIEDMYIELSIGDLVQVTDYLLGLLRIDIYNLGLILGLHQPHLKEMKTSETFRDDVIAAWLKKEDEVVKMGIPTWENLVKALVHPRVKQTEVASKIAADYNVTK